MRGTALAGSAIQSASRVSVVNRHHAASRQIEPADGDQAAPLVAESVGDRPAFFRIASRRHHTARFVEEDPPPRGRLLRLAVDGDLRAFRIDEDQRIENATAVDAHAAGADRGGRLRPREDAELRQRAIERDPAHPRVTARRDAGAGAPGATRQ